MNSTNTVIILVLILFVLYIKQYQENFVLNVYGVGGTCNDYIPDYNSCNVAPTFDSDNIENFACPCSRRKGCPYNSNCPCGLNCTCGINCSCDINCSCN
jgi:hypothetical protein